MAVGDGVGTVAVADGVGLGDGKGVEEMVIAGVAGDLVTSGAFEACVPSSADIHPANNTKMRTNGM